MPRLDPAGPPWIRLARPRDRRNSSRAAIERRADPMTTRSPGGPRPVAGARAPRPDPAARRPPASPSTSRQTAAAGSAPAPRRTRVWLRISAASVKRNRKQTLIDELARRPGEGGDALLAAPGVGNRQRHRCGAGAAPRTRPTERGQGRHQAPPTARLRSLSKNRFGLSSHSRSSPFTLKTRIRRLAAPSPRTSGRADQEPEEEQRKRGLGGDAGDPRDRHVSTLAAVEEVEVDEHRLAVATDADREWAAHLIDVERLARAPRRGRVRRSRPGRCSPTAQGRAG